MQSDKQKQAKHETTSHSATPNRRKTAVTVAVIMAALFIIMGVSAAMAYILMSEGTGTLKQSLDAQNALAKQTLAPIPTPTPEPTPLPTPTPTTAAQARFTTAPTVKAPPAEPRYKVYTDANFLFSCAYPAEFVGYIESARSVKYSVRSEDGSAALKLCAEENNGRLTAEQSLSIFKAEKGGYVHYESLGDTYYAVRMVSGETAYYRYMRLKNGKMYWFDFSYPYKYLDEYQPYVEHFYNSFTVN